MAAVIPRVNRRSDHWFGGRQIIVTATWDADRAAAASMRHGITHVTATHQLQQRPRQRYIHQPRILYALGKQRPDAAKQHLHVGHTVVVGLRQWSGKQTAMILDIVTSRLRTTAVVNLQADHMHNTYHTFWAIPTTTFGFCLTDFQS